MYVLLTMIFTLGILPACRVNYACNGTVAYCEVAFWGDPWVRYLLGSRGQVD
jgi:hypothetical protein